MEARDPSWCAHYRGRGTCTAGPCYLEPSCQTDRPLEGWPTELRARRYLWAFEPAALEVETELEHLTAVDAVVERVISAHEHREGHLERLHRILNRALLERELEALPF